MPLNRGVTKRDEELCNLRILANRYQVIKKLGSGNFGTAFLVKDLRPGKSDEFKVLKEIPVGDLAPDETIDAMHEANLLSKLNHPNIVKFCDSFIDGEFFCLVTEYCDGGDLDQKISALKKSGDRLDESVIVQYLIQLTMGVHYMHQRRVLHRDLKARNIFLRGNMIKIGDFGISRILMSTTDMASTFTGTPYYMSPEVLQHDGYNNKSDVWSIGCILYELCTKKHAFDGQGLMGVMYKIVEGKPPPLPEEYSADLQGVLNRIFVKDPEKRITAGELLKLPFVERHIQMYKTSMSSQCKDLSNTIVKKDTQELQALMAEKTTKSDLESSTDMDTMVDEASLTPKERMKLRKQREADERAKQLSEATRIQSAQNMEMTRLRKKETWLTSSMLPYRSYQPAPAFHIPSVNPATGKSYEVDGSTTLKSAYGPAVEDETLTAASAHKVYPKTATTNFPAGGRPKKTPVVLTPGYKAVAYEERPITPMKNTNIYDLKYNAMEFKDGTRTPAKFDPATLLEDPKLAETYYSQFDHEFDDEDDDKAADDEGTLVNGPDDTVADFYNCLQQALDTSMTNDRSLTLKDDPVKGFCGHNVKETKIRNLKAECIRKLGESTFRKVYSFLKQKRFVESNAMSETHLMTELRDICENVTDCFLVDQLVFLEEGGN